jgi:alanyl-tRNA synthetase
VVDDLEVTTRILPVDEAKAQGAMALFGEKYGDVVRMVDIGGPWSRELCAGTHVARSSQIGAINLVGENSVSAGARRVEAFVGLHAVKNFSVEREIVNRLSQLLKTPREDLPGRVGDLVDQVKNLEKTVSKMRQSAQGDQVPQLIQSAENLSGHPSVIAEVTGVESADDLRAIAQKVADGLGQAGVVVLASVHEGRATVIAVVSQSVQKAGVDASELVKRASQILGGGGGGKPGLAQGGGPNAGVLGQALSGIREHLTQ